MMLRTRLKGSFVVASTLAVAGTCGGCSGQAGSGNRTDIGGEQYRALETAAVTNPQESSLERATHSVKTVFLIVMENHNWSQIAGNR